MLANVGKKTYYNFTKASNGETYQFTVRTIYTTNGKPASGFKGTAAQRFYAAPKITKFAKASGGRYTLTWQKSPAAGKYRVYSWNGSKWITIGDTANITATVKCYAPAGEEPIYAIRVLNSSGKLVTSYWENVLKSNGKIQYGYPGTYAK